MIYDNSFYDSFDSTTKRAAELIIPYILERFKPKNIVDFGCGEGMWLGVVKKVDSSIDVCGIDGDYIDADELKIDRRDFCPLDLSHKIDLKKKFDLAISLEVGEHLSEEYADVYIDNICRHTDRILFSAAIPNQGGVNHVNERWQSYWIDKFINRGYGVDYSVRNFFWENKEIPYWRRQNLLFFSKYKEDFNTKENGSDMIANVVHPEMYLMKCDQLLTYMNLKKIYSMIDRTIKELVDKNIKQIVICPYGNHGFLCKEILNNKYHIKELAILDNNLSLTNPDIFPCDYLRELKGDYYVIENCGNKSTSFELLGMLGKYIPRNRIVSVFSFECK